MRPRGKAAREPRHFIPPRASTRARGLRGTCPGSSRSLPYGRAEPAPPLGCARSRDGIATKSPLTLRKGDSLVGRNLCARFDPSQIPPPPKALNFS